MGALAAGLEVDGPRPLGPAGGDVLQERLEGGGRRSVPSSRTHRHDYVGGLDSAAGVELWNVLTAASLRFTPEAVQ